MNTAGFSQGILEGLEANRQRDIEDKKLAYLKKLQDQAQEDRDTNKANVGYAGNVIGELMAPPPITPKGALNMAPQPQMQQPAPAPAPGQASVPNAPRPPMSPQMGQPMAPQGRPMPQAGNQGMPPPVMSQEPASLITPQDVIRTLKAKNVPPQNYLGVLEQMKPVFDMQGQQQIRDLRMQMEADKVAQNAKMDFLREERNKDLREHQQRQDETAGKKLTQEEVTPLTPEGMKLKEELISRNLKLPGGGKASVSETNKMLNEMAKTEEGGAGSGAVARKMAEGSAERSDLTSITKNVSNLRAYSGLVERQAEIAKDLITKITASDASLLNKPINAVLSSASDAPDLAEYKAQIQFLQSEAAKLLQSGQNITGALTVSAKQEMNQIVNGTMPLKSAVRVFDRIVADGRIRVEEYEKEKDRIAKATSGAGEQVMTLDEYLKSKGK